MGRHVRPRAADRPGRGDTPRPPVPGPSRSEARDAAARAKLEPLPEGERPGAVTVGAVVAALSGVANLALWLAGIEVRGERPSVLGIAFSGLLVVTAWGMWCARYWAVLAFEALLAITLVSVAVWLAVGASLVEALVFVAVVLVPGGMLFWLLVKAMARIQMPRQISAAPDPPTRP